MHELTANNEVGQGVCAWSFHAPGPPIEVFCRNEVIGMMPGLPARATGQPPDLSGVLPQLRYRHIPVPGTDPEELEGGRSRNTVRGGLQ